MCTVRESDISSAIEIMDFLEKEFGKNITTQNWNTLERIAQLLDK